MRISITICATTPIPDHRNGHYVKPNRVALKYPDLQKDNDPNAHVGMLNSIIKQM
jgi:hypothetical protein